MVDSVDYGFKELFNTNLIGAYSTLNKTPYDVIPIFSWYISKKWWTRRVQNIHIYI